MKCLRARGGRYVECTDETYEDVSNPSIAVEDWRSFSNQRGGVHWRLAMFHVKHQNNGLFRGIPTWRGYSFGVTRTFVKTWYAAPCRTRPSLRSPKTSSPSSSHRSTTESSGGSETIMTPPTFKNLTPHSAVTDGGPNERAVTRSAISTRSGRRAMSSTRPMITFAPPGEPSHSSTSSRKVARFAIESVRIAWVCHISRSTRAGSPPPLPRSTNTGGGVACASAQHSAKPCAWTICGSIAVGPK